MADASCGTLRTACGLPGPLYTPVENPKHTAYELFCFGKDKTRMRIWSAMTLLCDLEQVIEPFTFLPCPMKRLSCLISNILMNGSILLLLVFY